MERSLALRMPAPGRKFRRSHDAQRNWVRRTVGFSARIFHSTGVSLVPLTSTRLVAVRSGLHLEAVPL